MRFSYVISVLMSLCLLHSYSVRADDEAEGDHAHDESEQRLLEEVVVRAHPLSNDGFAQSGDVLSGEELARAVEATLADTLLGTSGVRSASFGPAVGRPVIHGLVGVRVKSMMDRTSTMDLAILNFDHPINVNTAMANMVEVIKGPSALVHGSEAVGGIVNVDTGRIPKIAPSDGWDARMDVRGSDNAAIQSFAGRVDFSMENLVFHADMATRQSDDYDFPGCAESQYVVHEEHDDHDEDEHHDDDDHDEHEEEEEEHHDDEEIEICGTLLNSYVDVSDGSIGASFVDDRGYIGVSVSTNFGKFGSPVPHAHGAEEHDDHGEEEHDDHDEGEEEHHDENEHHDEDEHHDDGIPRAVIDFTQERIDFDMRRDIDSDSIEALQVRFGASQYHHDELEAPDSDHGTEFYNDAYELRVDTFLNRENTSVIGAHLSGRDYRVDTEEGEPVLPVTEQRLGISWLHERPLGLSSLEIGTRLESKKVDSDDYGSRSFTNYALSAGLLSDQSKPWIFSLSANASSRSPAVEELSARGLHIAANTIERGNPDLDSESLQGVTVGASKAEGKLEVDLTAYYRRFQDFIYLEDTGRIEDGVPFYTYTHKNATFTGIDATLLYHMNIAADTELDLRFQYDTLAVTSDRNSQTPLPQMPADETTLALDLYRSALFASIAYKHSAAVTEIAPLELPTDSWSDLSGRVEYKFSGIGESMDITVYLKGKNLTDEQQRNHVSIIKDRAPLPGRMIEFGFRIDT